MILAFDTETYLITESDKAPKPVIATWSDGQRTWYTAPDCKTLRAAFADPENHIVGHNIAYDLTLLMRWHPETIPVIVQAYLEQRIWDTQIREQLSHLEHIGGTGYKQYISQHSLEVKYLDVDRSAQKKGDDIWRLKYGTLDGVPYDQWPQEALDYALNDAAYCHQVFIAQGAEVGAYATEEIQVRAALSLQMVSVWGFHTNQENVAKIEADLTQRMMTLKQELDAFTVKVDGKPMGLVGAGSAQALQILIKQGWQQRLYDKLGELAAHHRVKVDWKAIQNRVRDGFDLGHELALEEAKKPNEGGGPWLFCYNHEVWNPPAFIQAAKEVFKPIPRSTKGFKTGEQEIAPIIEYVPILKVRTEYKHLEKMMSTYIDPYRNKHAVHPNYSTLVTTGRTASDKPNLQNVPRDGGFRNNLWARPGYLLGTVDYAALEMVTLAATLVHRNCHNGRPDSEHPLPPLAAAINQGMDLHCLTASNLFGESYETFVARVAAEKKAKKAGSHAPTPYSDRRQGSKALNFGASGGLGPTSFQPYAKFTYGVDWSYDECAKYIRDWKEAWPDIRNYLRENGEQIQGWQGTAQAVNVLGRRKNDCIYTQLCNYPFQSLAADGAKKALWELTVHQLLGWFWTYASEHWDQARYHLGTRWDWQHQTYHGSPLRDSHVVNFIHDEVVQEHPEHLAEAAFALQQKIMVEAMSSVTMGVKVDVEGQLGRNWAH